VVDVQAHALQLLVQGADGKQHEETAAKSEK